MWATDYLEQKTASAIGPPPGGLNPMHIQGQPQLNWLQRLAVKGVHGLGSATAFTVAAPHRVYKATYNAAAARAATANANANGYPVLRAMGDEAGRIKQVAVDTYGPGVASAARAGKAIGSGAARAGKAIGSGAMNADRGAENFAATTVQPTTDAILEYAANTAAPAIKRTIIDPAALRLDQVWGDYLQRWKGYR